MARVAAAVWVFQPFVEDTYGDLRADARGSVARFIQRYHRSFQPLDETQAGRAIWCTISTALPSTSLVRTQAALLRSYSTFQHRPMNTSSR